jgi:hypothetical protein
MVELAKKLRRRKPKGGRRSLRAVALDLEKVGFSAIQASVIRCCRFGGRVLKLIPPYARTQQG